ncbi:MAG TPA: hypothetical protein VGR55_07460 [Candidatus Acidoferrum sp.]|nr:hypothetical protein [Candidatus Acidoferrum sp.]
MRIMLNAGSLDGQSLIEMNNLAVGYFPTEGAIGVYPQPVPQVLEQQQPAVPVNLQQQEQTNS